MSDALPPALRARLASDFRAVRPLGPPLARAMGVVPFAVLALVAAPLWFELRVDAPRLGWLQSWGWSLVQSMAGLAMVAAALREAIPGRNWGRGQLAPWLALPVALVILVTWTTFEASAINIDRAWVWIGLLCFTGSLATALPGVSLAAILASRAWPTRPAIAGLLGGLGAGLMADAGWRLFCHFSEPGHVLGAHLLAVIAAGLCGALLAPRLCATRETP
ncbi:MAG: NrsF family protein [Vicinamibacterales bacterium]